MWPSANNYGNYGSGAQSYGPTGPTGPTNQGAPNQGTPAYGLPMVPAAAMTDAYVQSDPMVQYAAATNPNWGANMWAQGQIRNGTGGWSVQQMAAQAYSADAQWKQQQMQQQQGQPGQTGQPTTQTGQPTTQTGQPTTQTGQPTTQTGQPTTQTGQPQQPAKFDVTKADYSNPSKFATDTKDSFGGLSEAEQDYAAIQFVLNTKNEHVKDRGDDDLNDGKYSLKDIDHVIKLAQDSGNTKLVESLNRVKTCLMNLDYADGEITGDKDLSHRRDLEQVRDKIGEKLGDPNSKMTLLYINAQVGKGKPKVKDIK